jgi:beta-lactamase class A/glyoxylase-like metal-dependent hydrolase (beta-lactamase superfamily II)
MLPALAALLVAFAPAVPAPAHDSADRADSTLARELRTLADRAGGTVGVAAIHLESGRRLSVEGATPFPMASVYKVPIALAVLRAAARRELRLDERLPIGVADLRLGRSPLASAHPRGGVSLTVGELLEHTVTRSDNTASDVLLARVGGARNVMAALHALGVRGVDVSRAEAALLFDGTGVRRPPPPARWSPALLDSLTSAVPPDERRRAHARFIADPRDTATPDAMADLLARLWRGELLDRAGTARLLALMTDAEGPPRFAGPFPPGLGLVHKTGTCLRFDGVSACVNDVGIIPLAGGAGHAVVAVFVKGSDRDPEAIDEAIGAIAGAVARGWGRAPGAADRVRVSPDLSMRRLAPGVWMHTSWGSLQGSRVASNGLLVERPEGALLIDTAWDDAQTDSILAWAARTLARPVAAAVVTHAHDDRLGGLDALRRAGIPVHALALTRRRAAAAGFAAATLDTIAATPALVHGVELFYPGAGHAPDNLVAWLPGERVLFGGCLVKSADARGLGFTGDADIGAWPLAIERVQEAYGGAAIVVPGHGEPGGPELLAHTLELLARARAAGGGG